MDRLDPKLDVVFKLLFLKQPDLLKQMVSAVLAEPVDSITILNPEIPKELSQDKGIVLDIRVQLNGGKRVDVEMQIRHTTALTSRLLYYAARDFANQLSQGHGYDKLTPTVVVVWMVEPLFRDAEDLHSVYELRERRRMRLFSDQLAIHVIELSKLARSLVGEPDRKEDSSAIAAYEHSVTQWARFLTATTPGELTTLAQEDPTMATALKALDTLSQDPEAQRLARERSDAIKLYHISLVASRDEGRQEGLAEGEQKGRQEGLAEGEQKGQRDALRSTNRRFLTRRFGPLPEWAEQRLQEASVEELETISEALLDAQTLEEVMA